MEKIEKNKNAQLAREIEIALPVELSARQNVSLVRDYCRKHFVDAGMCADICIHDKNDGNPHAHIMLTMRPFEQDRSWAAKSRKEYMLDENGERILLKSGAFKSRKVDATDWNDRGKAEEWRQAWAEMCNTALEQQGVSERIDHRSYERQSIEQIPTIHLGPKAFQMEKRWIRMERGDINRQVHLDNKMLAQLRARIRKLESAMDELPEAANPSHPIQSGSLIEILTDTLSHADDKTRGKKITDLKTVAKAISFAEQNNISDLIGLRNKTAEMRNDLNELSGKLKKNERRRETLQEHLRHIETYKDTLDIYHQYIALKPKRQPAFFEDHRAEITRHESARKHFESVLNGRTALPVRKWEKELAMLDGERNGLYTDYTQLRGEVQNAESILRCVEQILRRDILPQAERVENAEL